jgi:hypothetical protein
MCDNLFGNPISGYGVKLGGGGGGPSGPGGGGGDSSGPP